MNKRLELILHEVNRQYRSERAFYHSELGITQRAWEKYKTGETDFENIKLSTYERMIALLFTPYEAMLINQAIQAVNYNWYDNVIDAFHDIKLKHAHIMLDRGATIEVQKPFLGDERLLRESVSKINIVDELGINNVNIVTFQIQIPSTLPKDRHLRLPSGQENRREWFRKYFENVVVK